MQLLLCQGNKLMNVGKFFKDYAVIFIMLFGFGFSYINDHGDSILKIVSKELVGLKEQMVKIEDSVAEFSRLTINQGKDITKNTSVTDSHTTAISTLHNRMYLLQDEIADLKIQQALTNQGLREHKMGHK